jgi:hypothetical protein
MMEHGHFDENEDHEAADWGCFVLGFLFIALPAILLVWATH